MRFQQIPMEDFRSRLLEGGSSEPMAQAMVDMLDAKNKDGPVPVRDWLCDALTPMAQRRPQRLALVDGVRSELARAGILPADASQARSLIDAEVKNRVRRSGRSNVSRAVSELVRAGLLTRHYQGYRVDHQNRGTQRQAVYTITPEARSALGRAM